MTKNFPQHWILQTAFNISFAPAWYFSDTEQENFYYHNEFTTDVKKSMIPNGWIFSICLLSNKPTFTTTGGFL